LPVGICTALIGLLRVSIAFLVGIWTVSLWSKRLQRQMDLLRLRWTLLVESVLDTESLFFRLVEIKERSSIVTTERKKLQRNLQKLKKSESTNHNADRVVAKLKLKSNDVDVAFIKCLYDYGIRRLAMRMGQTEQALRTLVNDASESGLTAKNLATGAVPTPLIDSSRISTHRLIGPKKERSSRQRRRRFPSNVIPLHPHNVEDGIHL
jgi:hypothetical protein